MKIYQSFLWGSVMMLSACAPFIDSRREAGQMFRVGQSTLDKVAVCYVSWNGQEKEIMSLAENECAKTGRIPVYAETKYFNCRLFVPNTIFFTCEKEKSENSKGKTEPLQTEM